ncbi:MAG: helix-turn-helix domain-containing protein [Rubrobacteraceae bacterium]
MNEPRGRRLFNRLRSIRIDSDESLADTAEALGIGARHLYNIERGGSPSPPLPAAIAAHFGLPLHQIFSSSPLPILSEQIYHNAPVLPDPPSGDCSLRPYRYRNTGAHPASLRLPSRDGGFVFVGPATDRDFLAAPDERAAVFLWRHHIRGWIPYSVGAVDDLAELIAL